MHKPLVTLLLSFAALGIAEPVSATDFPNPVVATRPDRAVVFHGESLFCRTQLQGELFVRTELVFGLSRSSGPDISETEFQAFIDDRVTSRFPEGLTVLSGNGQFKTANGTIVQEKSKLLVLLYPFSTKRHKLVEEIRADYKAMFQQESVLRIDEEMCASF